MMPAKKPFSLVTWHESKAEHARRIASATSMSPKSPLSRTPPAALKGKPRAAATWRALVTLYSQAEGQIANAFDENLIADFCLAENEIGELAALRAQVKDLWMEHCGLLAKMKPKPEARGDYYGAFQQAHALLQRYQNLDGRIDRKRTMLVLIEQSLFLTPRSRANVAPTMKQPAQPRSDMDRMLEAPMPDAARAQA